MEQHEISMFMDVKLNINDRRSDVLKFKCWTRCLVKIEAIKCLPCFMRFTLTPIAAEQPNEITETIADTSEAALKNLTISIILPGITISLATSRTKEHSYGLFWKQNRRDCFIYFALETEETCRCHMKWMKKSIKNLELHRQVFLEQRRLSRGPGRFGVHARNVESLHNKSVVTTNLDCTEESCTVKSAPTTLGPLPQIPAACDMNSSSWSRHASRVSEIYEEIFEGNNCEQLPTQLSRRISCTSIASGIYEEMKANANGFNAIVEEFLIADLPPTPPPLPPFPQLRKRINTNSMEQQGLLGEIPRSNTNPESEMAKKKKYKTVLNNIFGSGRSKRSKSVSEGNAHLANDVIGSTMPNDIENHSPTTILLPVYANDEVDAKRSKKNYNFLLATNLAESKRNSFSSPDLSKINFLDTFDDDKVAEILHNPFIDSIGEDLSRLGNTLNNCSIPPFGFVPPRAKAGSLESLNLSQQISGNFNFSACNTSTMNLVGANGAVPPPPNPLKNKIIIDDLTGYCIMAPIRPKKSALIRAAMIANEKPRAKTESTSSGYSTGSYCSTSSSCTNTTEEQLTHAPPKYEILRRDHRLPLMAEEGAIYENLVTFAAAGTTTNVAAKQPAVLCQSPNAVDFSDNLYENLLAVKAAQELEQPTMALSTSTPTESPLTSDVALPAGAITGGNKCLEEDEEDYYQTPRKSIISVDEKIPSYYPNSCDTVVKMRRSGQSPMQTTPPSASSEKTSTCIGLRQLVSLKMRRQRISSPQDKEINEQRHDSTSSNGSTDTTSSHRSSKSNKKNAVHKISENVYAVTHARKKSANSNKSGASPTALNVELRDKLQEELLQMAVLQSIDFKFDDTKELQPKYTPPPPNAVPLPKLLVDGVISSAAAIEQENCYQAAHTTDADAATRLLHKYAQLATQPATPAQHHLQLNQAANTQHQLANNNKAASAGKANNKSAVVMTQSTKLEAPVTTATAELQWKKFASLPRFKKIDFSPLKLKINNVLQRNQTDF